MTKTTCTIVLFGGLTFASSSVIHAQTVLTGKAYVNVNLGAQTQQRDANTTFSKDVYLQTANGRATHALGRGAMFDINGGYRVWQDIAVTVGFSTFNKRGHGVGAATVPSPISFNQPASVVLGPVDVDRSDRNVYVLGVWFLPVSDKIDLALSLGPSFTHVKQELIAGMDIPAGTQTATPAVQRETGTATGVNIGLDATYLFTKTYGAGVFVRYNGGSVDLASASDVKAGGFQVGIGARIRF